MNTYYTIAWKDMIHKRESHIRIKSEYIANILVKIIEFIFRVKGYRIINNVYTEDEIAEIKRNGTFPTG